jgi:hypothetical protein
MRRLMTSMACTLLSLSSLAVAEDASSPVGADSQPDGTVNLTAGTAAAGVGYVWGHGELNFQGQTHPFSISGLSVVDVGAANISASGHDYHLKRLSDFAGNYFEVTASATVAGGGSAADLKNEHGVVVKLEAITVGLRFNLSADGVKVTLKG